MSNVPGSLPKTASFQTAGGPLVIMVSGSAFKPMAMLGLLVVTGQLDGATIGDLRFYSNEAFSHRAFPTRSFVVAPAAAGAHTITLLEGPATLTDGNDFFSVTVLEMDPGGP